MQIEDIVISSENQNLKLWRKLGGSPLGRWLHARAVCAVAPYFGSIKPIFRVLEPGHVVVAFKNRRSVQNHLKSVHAIAMCNAAELAGGVCMDASLRSDHRWIPVGMTVQYLKMAKTNLVATCKIEQWDWEGKQDIVMPVSITDTHGEEVFRADISMRISPKVQRAA